MTYFEVTFTLYAATLLLVVLEAAFTSKIPLC